MLRLEGSKLETWRTSSQLVDALPYVDGLNPQSRQQVDALIEEEARKGTKRPADYLHEMGPGPTLKFDEHPLLAAEYERVKAKQPMKPLDTSRYRLDTPVASKQNDPGSWRSCLDNAHAQLEHQYLRILNLDLLLKYGDKTWRAQTQLSEATQKQAEEELQATKKRITELNQERKLSQLAAGAELRKLYDEYFQSVKKNLDIDNACERLQDEVDRMRARLEAHERQQQQEQQQREQQQKEQQQQEQRQQEQQQKEQQQQNGPEVQQDGPQVQQDEAQVHQQDGPQVEHPPQEGAQQPEEQPDAMGNASEDAGGQGRHEMQEQGQRGGQEHGSGVSQNGNMETD
ncbi:breast carcinoma amplified sequence 2-domain-containing protein [Dunaliella salina]|uniref:Breast carcinoma amplified sequence 2-domain-containing protein n=1 Tax=Dunaliella salina TaxID=3046 RepID=A0ABQ7H7P7_DUNSA|nr:breast carcinoma amplified sequence 2-domain-containing protein [Dunaliella salina]|eukprot:KAF5842863.1 breast carcinoma amplified sequence 2-domain-containing protein [Dunaliella salina]